MFTNRGISAFLKLLRSMLKTVDGPVDRDTMLKYLKPLQKWDNTHWETKKLKNSYVGAKGWKDFHRDLVKVIKRTYREFEE
jgi:hypothetical protein